MFTIKIDDIPEEGLDLNWQEERASLLAYMKELSEIDFDFERPLQAEAVIKKMQQSIFIAGKVQTSLRLQCARCLKEFSYPLSAAFELTLYPMKEAPAAEETELGSEELESSFFEGGEIHLSEIACEQIFLEMPYQPVCQEDCKGLCPMCGKDMNLSSCECKKEGLNTGFGALKKLKLD